MKPSIILIAFASLFASSHLYAQGRLFLGATAGMSSTHLTGDLPENGSYTSKTGFTAGLIGEYAFWNDIRISVQPSYVRRGTGVAYDIGEEDPRDSLQLTLDYVSIPVMARFLTPGGTWFINGGLDVSFLLDASLKDINAGGAIDVKNLMNDVDLMMILGVGASVHFEPALLTFELRYGQSLINAGANDQLAAKLGFSPRFRSAGFQFLVALLYPL